MADKANLCLAVWTDDGRKSGRELLALAFLPVSIALLHGCPVGFAFHCTFVNEGVPALSSLLPGVSKG